MAGENNTEHIVFELHPKEVELILAIRKKFPYGEITIKTRNGLPFRIVRTTEFDDLTPEG